MRSIVTSILISTLHPVVDINVATCKPWHFVGKLSKRSLLIYCRTYVSIKDDCKICPKVTRMIFNIKNVQVSIHWLLYRLKIVVQICHTWFESGLSQELLCSVRLCVIHIGFLSLQEKCCLKQNSLQNLQHLNLLNLLSRSSLWTLPGIW